jgi:hypothetical protein
MQVSRVAYGAGSRDLPGQPNVLRLMIGALDSPFSEDRSIIIETNIDDMDPRLYGHLIEQLMAKGAQDAFLTPIIMKKGRPAVLVTVLCGQADSDAVLDTLFRETTSIGVRIREVGRKKLDREEREVLTPYGTVRTKVSRRGGEVLTVTPEYEDCRRLAVEKGVPLKTVIEAAKQGQTG